MKKAALGAVGLSAGYLFSIMPRIIHKPDRSAFKTRYFAHRGLHENGTDKPENSLAAIRAAAEAGGSGFMQFGLIHDGETVMQLDRPRARCYRTLAELNGALCVIDSVRMLHFDEFLAELHRLGVKNALYMDMGAGWNYSWLRDAEGKVLTLFGLPVPWSHNWIVFRK
jgi:hypothetical protein